MNEINIKLSVGQVALALELLKPYAELSIQLSNQCRNQANARAMPGTVKSENIGKTEVNNG